MVVASTRLSQDGKPFAWRTMPVVIRPSGASDKARSVLASAAKEAANLWPQPCWSARVVLGEPVASASVRDDGVNVLVVRDDSCCKNGDPRGPCYDPDVAAMSTLSFRRAADGTLEITDVDIEVNAVHYSWDGLPRTAARPSPASLDRVLSHEFGHALGFDDSCEAGGPRDVAGTDPAAVLSCAEHWKRLEHDVMFPFRCAGGCRPRCRPRNAPPFARPTPGVRSPARRAVISVPRGAPARGRLPARS